MIPLARVLDELLEASVIGSFSRIGLSVRSRVLPEFTGGERPSFAGRVALVTEPPPGSAAQRPSNWHAWGAEPCNSWPVLRAARRQCEIRQIYRFSGPKRLPATSRRRALAPAWKRPIDLASALGYLIENCLRT